MCKVKNLKLQKNEPQSAGSYFLLSLYHLSLMFIYGLGVYMTYVGIPKLVNSPKFDYLGAPKYFTVWNLHFQLIIAFLHLITLYTSNKKIVYLRDLIHHGLSFPIGMLVFGFFWALYLIDPKLVFPGDVAQLIPVYVNHIIHTLIAITPVVNEFLVYNQRTKASLFLFVSCILSYIAFMFYVGFILNFWIYPVFEVFHMTGKLVFVVICLLIGMLIYLTHGELHKLVWAQKIKESKKKRL